eukprot:3921661-Amphidinium_carterae.1
MGDGKQFFYFPHSGECSDILEQLDPNEFDQGMSSFILLVHDKKEPSPQLPLRFPTPPQRNRHHTLGTKEAQSFYSLMLFQGWKATPFVKIEEAGDVAKQFAEVLDRLLSQKLPERKQQMHHG